MLTLKRPVILTALIVLMGSCAPLLAQSHSSVGHEAIAQTALTKAGNVDPAFDRQLAQCRGLVVRRHLDRAKPLITSLLRVHPASADLWMLMGVCDMQPAEDIDRHHAEAKRSLNKALSLDPQLGEAYFYLADLESFSGNWPNAIAFANKATTVARPDATAYRLSAVAYNAQSRPKEALVAIEQYIKARPSAGDGPPIKAAILENAGNYSQADKVYKQILAGKLIDKYIFADEKCLVKLGRTSDAIALVGRLIAANPHDEVALRERAKLYKQSGKYNEAIRDLSASLDEMPSSTTYKERAELYKKINRLDLCKKDLEHADAE
jgi:tetratricopeptide (TPR) repeat protein